MDLYQLEYVSEIERAGNISKAAERLHISQPTLSIYLTKLERSLGIKLFERQKNSLVPTQAGEKYIEACRRILAIRDELYEDLFSQRNSVLRLGILRTSIRTFNQVLYDLKSRYPNVSVLPQIFSSEQIYQEIAHGNLDMGFVTSYLENIREAFPRMDYTIVREYELVLMISTHNPVYSRLHLENGCLSPDSYGLLGNLPIFLGTQAMINKRMSDSIFPILGISPKKQSGLIDIEFMSQAMVTENSFCILPSSKTEGTSIVQIPFVFHPKIYRLFIYPSRMRLTGLCRELIEQVRTAYEKLPCYYDLTPR